MKLARAGAIGIAASLFALSTSVVLATFYNEGQNVDITADTPANADLAVKALAGSPPTGLAMINGAEKAFSSDSYANTDCADVSGKTFSAGGDFLPSDGDVYLVKQGTRFGKFVFNSVTPNVGVDITHASLGACPVDPPPVSSFTSVTYDHVAFFTDTSTNTPTMWSWNFGDTNTSTQKNPSHFYATSGTKAVSLTASNSGGTGTTANNNVVITTRPSTTEGIGGAFDLDGDGTDDIAVIAPNGCSGNITLDPINGATWAGASEDYRTVTDTDIPGSITSTSNFCMEEGVNGLFDTRFVQTSAPSVAKMWAPEISSTSIRMEFEVLTTTLPPPPTTSWTHETYDLIAFFTDTSTGGPGSWSWNFGDGNSSTSQNPSHFYASEGTRSVSMTASNTGGAGPTVMHDVTVTKVTSMTMGAGGTVDLDGDGSADLQAVSMVGCSGDLVLRVINGSMWAGASEDYRTVDMSDIPMSITGTSDFCTEDEVNGLFDTRFLKNGTGDVMKFWTPELTPSLVRLESDILTETCAVDYDLMLGGINVAGVTTYEACNEIAASTVVVMNGGDLTLRAGSYVVLQNGFSVEPGGLLDIVLEVPTP